MYIYMYTSIARIIRFMQGSCEGFIARSIEVFSPVFFCCVGSAWAKRFLLLSAYCNLMAIS